ncbi:MAG: HD domain-containing protein [Candidatus Nealsonbacteria bacterium]|nr:HD domain-containing protein [Candidatus Nealsonbacteria bacterium]
MQIPKEVKTVVDKLEKSKFQAYIVGGCVRDLLRGITPNDWDVTTNAKPEQIQKLFLHPPKFCGAKLGRAGSFYENRFGTVTVLTCSQDVSLKEIEITTYRLEAKYTDKRHPDEIKFAKTLEQDLARRDFTINAIALESYEAKPRKIVDPFLGQEDLKNKVIRAVGQPEDRFSDDALRMLRAVRLASTLDFTIEPKTAAAIKKHSPLLKAISKERIRDEVLKIIMSDKGAEGIDLLRELGLLSYIMPELEEGYQVGQNKHHIYECYEHSLLSLKYACHKKYNKHVRLASLLHDIGKPRTKRGQGQNSTFYGHEVVGAKMTNQLLSRLKFPKKDIDKITNLVRHHLFYYNVGEVTESSVRRLVRQAGPENMEELLQVRMCDRIGSGVPKAEPYKLRHLRYIIEKTSKDPISVKMLKITGNDIMKELDISPGPKIGHYLDILLGNVLLNPKKNETNVLFKLLRQMSHLSEKELKDKALNARKEREKIEIKQDKMTKERYWVS